MATVVAGCYERFLFGFDATVDGDVSVSGGRGGEAANAASSFRGAAGSHAVPSRAFQRTLTPPHNPHTLHTHTQASTLRRSFYVPVHSGPVKCVAAAAPFVATGGADDVIHLFDVAVSVCVGSTVCSR